MKRGRLAAWSVLALLAGISPTAAQQRPATIPTRDVDVTYRMMAGDQQLSQRMRWLAAQQMLRVDPPTPGLYMIVDYRTHRVAVVREADREVLDLDAAAATLPGGAGGPNGSFTRRGEDQVAGLACTEWQTTDTAGDPTLACITPDGVLLRARIGDRTMLEAASVVYGPQDAAAFRTPSDYTHVKSPQR